MNIYLHVNYYNRYFLYFIIYYLCRYVLLLSGGNRPSLPGHLWRWFHYILWRWRTANKRHGFGRQRVYQVQYTDHQCRTLKVRVLITLMYLRSGAWPSWGIWSQCERGITGKLRWTRGQSFALELRTRTRRETHTSAWTRPPGVWDTFWVHPGNFHPSWSLYTCFRDFWKDFLFS